MNNDEEKCIISADEAISLLPEGATVHNYTNAAGGLMMGGEVTARIPCCVPFCKRTCEGNDVDSEMVCRTHGMAVSKPTRLFMLRRKAERAMQKEPENCTEQEQRYVLRLERIARKAWLLFKFEAIEKAGGIA